MEKEIWTLKDIERLYDTVAIGVIVVMNAVATGGKLDLDQLTEEAEEKLVTLPHGENWYRADPKWREKLVETITEHIEKGKDPDYAKAIAG